MGTARHTAQHPPGGGGVVGFGKQAVPQMGFQRIPGIPCIESVGIVAVAHGVEFHRRGSCFGSGNFRRGGGFGHRRGFLFGGAGGQGKNHGGRQAQGQQFFHTVSPL